MYLKDNRNDIILTRFLFAYFAALMFFTVTKRLFGNDASSTVALIIVILPFVLPLSIKAIIIIFKIHGARFALYVVITYLLYSITLARIGKHEKFNQYIVETTLGLILFCAVACINNGRKMYDTMVKTSNILLAFAIPIIFVRRDIAEYSMRFSYLLSIALLFHTSELFRGKIRDILFVFLEIFLILFYGARGPLVCFGAYCFLKLVLTEKKLAIKVVAITTFIIIVNNFQAIGKSVLRIMYKYGMRSRTLTLIFTNLNYTSGRNEITNIVKSMIMEKPFLGWGITGEYSKLNVYPHNILLELCLDYGIVIGIAVFIVIIFTILRGIVTYKDMDIEILLVFISYGFVPLLFSGTYLTWDGFFILMGLLLKGHNRPIKLKTYYDEHTVLS